MADARDTTEPVSAYLRHPAVAGDTLLFVADDDIWIAALGGGRAHRLTDGRSAASHPVPSPDGTTLAFTLRDEHHPEAWIMPLEGGSAQRLSYLGGSVTATRAWHPDGRVVVATNDGCAFARDSQLVAVGPTPGHHQPLGWGSAHEVALVGTAADRTRVLIGRHTTNQGRWKRYRGGTAGQLWLDPTGSGTFRRLLAQLGGDIGAPMLIGDRVWFLSDHQDVANLWSCDLHGDDLTAHSTHRDFYARFAATDGHHVVYACGGDLWVLEVAGGGATGPRRLDVTVASARVQRSRSFADAGRWLQSYAVHPTGTHVALRVRGRPFTMPLFDGAVVQHGKRQGANHRLVRWLPDGQRLVMVADSGGEERIEVHGAEGLVRRFDELDLGVPSELAVAPVGDRVALTDQQGRLRVVDLGTGAATTVVETPFGVDRPAWSPDGRWLAFSQRESNWYTASIRLWQVGSAPADVVIVSDDRAAHRAPAWDPQGRHLYWIAGTRFDPVTDGIYFDHGFPHPDAIVAAVLREDGRHPLDREPHAPGSPPGRKGDVAVAAGRQDIEADEDTRAAAEPEPVSASTADPLSPSPTVEVVIDVAGLPERCVVLPFPTGRYQTVIGLHDKVMALAMPLRPEPITPQAAQDRRPAGQLEVLSLDSARHEVIVPTVSSGAVSADARTRVYAVKKGATVARLRAVRAGIKPADGAGAEGASRISGWLDSARVVAEVDPASEWRQLFEEAWRLQRDLFWHVDMSGVDWVGVRRRYVALIDRIATRAELSDLIWEMFGELGTGHAYERGGDHPVPPRMPLGRLGADVVWDGECWVLERVLTGDPSDPGGQSPLRAPGVRLTAGARVCAVDGVRVDATTSPASLLVNRAGKEVALEVSDPTPRQVSVRTFESETALRYTDWVAANRDAVRQASGGRIAYVHVPDMGAAGYAAFHRQYLSAVYADALIVDVRFNGGGNVSSLILEKLAGRRIGYQLRRTGALEPFPHHAPAGPLVAITNERCGSDGDIFTHAWKRLQLGPVVGTRTWGGVIGIQPRHSSVDGTITTQPGFAFWFDDVGWGVENYGTDPTHVVEIAPHDAAAGHDPQLDAAIALATEALDAGPVPPLPDRGTAPDLGRPG
ncbi:MAG TPA: PDZ domain-containing protein [Euzebya sp.]|nr:PDZ domain-containing protein [Euzebya sp.]